MKTEIPETQFTEMRAERDALLALLKDAPPRQAIDDQRYWEWRQRVDALLMRLEAERATK